VIYNKVLQQTLLRRVNCVYGVNSVSQKPMLSWSICHLVEGPINLITVLWMCTAEPKITRPRM